jgi:hypothetical protein
LIGALSRPIRARLARAPGRLVAIGWCAAAAAFALAAHRGGSSHAADDVAVGAFGSLVLPLLAYGVARAAVGGRSLSASIAPVVALGATPARAAAVAVIVASAAGAMASALLGAGVVALAHTAYDPPIVRDALATAYAGALGGGAYVAWFMLGATFGKGGAGRALLLLLDWGLGYGDSAAAVFTPRGHLRNLLGGDPPMDLLARGSALLLIALWVTCALIAIRRAR